MCSILYTLKLWVKWHDAKFYTIICYKVKLYFMHRKWIFITFSTICFEIANRWSFKKILKNFVQEIEMKMWWKYLKKQILPSFFRGGDAKYGILSNWLIQLYLIKSNSRSFVMFFLNSESNGTLRKSIRIFITKVWD